MHVKLPTIGTITTTYSFARVQEYLGFPDGCERANCNAYFQWTLVDNDKLAFELEGTAEGWVAVGVSADRVMGGDGIDDVFVCQRDAATDAVYAQDTYAKESESTRSYERDSVCCYNQNSLLVMVD